MKRKDWFVALSPLVITWLIDRLTKGAATHLTGITFFGPLGFLLHHNYGAMLGAFSDVPAVLRVVSLCTGGAFLLFLFGIIQFLLPTKSLLMRSGLSFLMGGIIGNVTDRILWGYVVDFIVFGTPSHLSPAFNLADALQWIGYGMLVIGFLKDGNILWPSVNVRKKYWINPRFQLRYSIALMACGLGLSVIAGTYSFTYLSVTIDEFKGSSAVSASPFLRTFMLTYIIISAAAAGMLFLVGLVLSHRAAGPLYAFERFLNAALKGEHPKLKLRNADEFKELERLAEKLSNELNPRSSRSKSG